MSLRVPLESPASFWRSEKRRQILRRHREEYRNSSSSDVQLVFWVFNITLLLCLLLSTFGHRRPQFWPHRVWSRCDWYSGQSIIHPWITWGGRLFRMRNLVDLRQHSERLLCSSMFHESSILLSSKIVQTGFCLPHDVNVF